MVKTATAQIRLVPSHDLQLPLALRSRSVDSALRYTLGVFAAKGRIDNVKGPIPLLHSFTDERHENTIPFVRRAKECTNVHAVVQIFTKETNGFSRDIHGHLLVDDPIAQSRPDPR